MKFNCGLTWRQRRRLREEAWDKAKVQWHPKFIFKVRIGTICYVLQYMERRWIPSVKKTTRWWDEYGIEQTSYYWTDPYWEYREPARNRRTGEYDGSDGI